METKLSIEATPLEEEFYKTYAAYFHYSSRSLCTHPPKLKFTAWSNFKIHEVNGLYKVT
jgi:hypothetical protein